MMLPAKARSLTRSSSFMVAHQIERRLAACPARIRRFEAAAGQAAATWVPLPMRAGTLQRYLVLLDLAAIFEWATGQTAGRRVRTDVWEEAGKEYGPFYDLARVVWPMIFGSEKGLSNALRTWAKGRALRRDVWFHSEHRFRQPRMADLGAIAVHFRHSTARRNGHI